MASGSRQIQDHDRPIKVTILASEWSSSKDGRYTINRELAIQFAKFPCVKVTVLLPECANQSKEEAQSYGISIVEAKRRPGYEKLTWLTFPPKHLKMDVVVGFGVKLGKQAQVIRESHKCKWVQVVHKDPEEQQMFKCCKNRISKGEENLRVEVELCQLADLVVGVGPKVTEAYRTHLSWCKKVEDVFELTPGVFADFACVEQVPVERKHFRVLVFGRGDSEDFELKGFDIAATSVAALSYITLVFVGAPEGKRDGIAERFCDLGIPANRLRVRGNTDREALWRLFCEVDLLLMPSRTEGFGLTGLKGLSAGLPVIVSKNSGFGEVLVNVPHGSSFVIDSEEPSAWTAAIKNICSKDRRLRLQEARVLRDSYEKRYDWSEQCKNLIEKMVSLLKNKQGSSDKDEDIKGGMKIERKKCNDQDEAGSSDKDEDIKGGMKIERKKCSDQDEAAEPARCNSDKDCLTKQAKCIRRECHCVKKFAFGDGKTKCEQWAECPFKTDPCKAAGRKQSKNSHCVRKPETQTVACRCDRGYFGRPQKPSCMKDKGAGDHSCLTDKNCPHYSKCVKNKCTCRFELIGDGETCKAAPPMSCSKSDDCHADKGKCVAGMCFCDGFFVGNGIVCRDAKPCSIDVKCGSHSTCMVDPLFPKTPICKCEAGYKKTKTGKCVECLNNTDCNQVQATCYNGICKCKDELIKDEKMCKPAPLHACKADIDCDARAKCLDGKRVCQRNTTGNGKCCRVS